MRQILMLSFLLAFCTVTTQGQDLVYETIWKKVRHAFEADDTTALQKLPGLVKTDYEYLAFLSALGERPNALRYSLSRITPFSNEAEVMDIKISFLLQDITLYTANQEIANILKTYEIRFPTEVIKLVANYEWAMYRPLLLLHAPLEFEKYTLKPPSEHAVITFIDWLLKEGYRYDYSQLDHDIDEASSQGKVFFKYLSTLRPPNQKTKN